MRRVNTISSSASGSGETISVAWPRRPEPSARTEVEYIEAGVTQSNVRTQRRWIEACLVVHLLLLLAVTLPFDLRTDAPIKPSAIRIVTPLHEPSFKPAAQPAPKTPAPPRLIVRGDKPPKEPRTPVKSPIDPEKVDPYDATLIYIDRDLHQLESVLQSENGCIAFGPPAAKPEAIPTFTDKFCRAGAWRPQPLLDGHESAGRYFAIRLGDGFGFVNSLRAENNVRSDYAAYAVFPKSLRTEVYLLIVSYAARRGIQHPTQVQVEFSAGAPSGFEVIDASESVAQPVDGRNLSR